MSTNKVLLEHSPGNPSLNIVYGGFCFLAADAMWPATPKIFAIWLFFWKSLQISSLALGTRTCAHLRKAASYLSYLPHVVGTQ